MTQVAEDSYLVDGRQAIRWLVQKSVVLIEAANDGNEDDSEGSKRRVGTSSHLWSRKMATTTREMQ